MNGAPMAGPPPSGDGGGPVALSTPVRRPAVAPVTAIAPAPGTG